MSLVLGWRRFRWLGRRQWDRRGGGLAYTPLSGEERQEMLKLCRRAEKLLRRQVREARQPWQTLGDYTTLAPLDNPEAQAHLSWFTSAAWQAAYNPNPLDTSLLAQAHHRLARRKAALNTSQPIKAVHPA